MKTFVRAAELWTPSADGTLLEHAGGCYGDAPAFGALSRQMCFGRAEGLPGAAWDDERPQLWAPLPAGRFVRARAAAEAGIECAIALPFYARGQLTSVAVLFFAGADDTPGAVELWRNDARVTDGLRLAERYAGDAPQASADAPALAQRRGGAVLIDDLAAADGAPRGLRVQARADAGRVRALALPCSGAGGQAWVVSLLSSADVPIARRVEGWLADRDAGTLRCAFGHCGRAGRLAADDGAGHAFDAMGAIGRAARDGAAHVQSDSAAHAALAPAQAADAGLRSLLALPMPGGDGVDEVVALYF